MGLLPCLPARIPRRQLLGARLCEAAPAGPSPPALPCPACASLTTGSGEPAVQRALPAWELPIAAATLGHDLGSPWASPVPFLRGYFVPSSFAPLPACPSAQQWQLSPVSPVQRFLCCSLPRPSVRSLKTRLWLGRKEERLDLPARREARWSAPWKSPPGSRSRGLRREHGEGEPCLDSPRALTTWDVRPRLFLLRNFRAAATCPG